MAITLYDLFNLTRENDSQIKNFLKRTDNAKYEGITADWGVECDYGRQLLTGDKEDHDGFFILYLVNLNSALLLKYRALLR